MLIYKSTPVNWDLLRCSLCDGYVIEHPNLNFINCY